MNTFWILMEQIELFIVYLVIGMILVRTGVLSDKGLDWIARVVMKLSLPTSCLIDGQCPFYDFLVCYGLEDVYPNNLYNTLSGLILDELATVI